MSYMFSCDYYINFKFEEQQKLANALKLMIETSFLFSFRIFTLIIINSMNILKYFQIHLKVW